MRRCDPCTTSRSQAHDTSRIARSKLLEASGSTDLEEALAWIANGYGLTRGSDRHVVLRALATLASEAMMGGAPYKRWPGLSVGPNSIQERYCFAQTVT